MKVPGAVKMTYKSASERQATRPTVQSTPTHVTDQAHYHRVVDDSAAEAGSGSACDAVHMNTARHESADVTAEAGTAPTSDANTVQQSQRQVVCTVLRAFLLRKFVK